MEASRGFLPEIVVGALPAPMTRLAEPGFESSYGPLGSRLAELDDASAERLRKKCRRFQEEVGRTFGSSILPEPKAGEVRLDGRQECLLRYRDRRARLVALRWGALVQLRERLKLSPRSRRGAVLAFLEEVLAFPLQDGGRPVVPRNEKTFEESGGAYVELTAPRSGFGGRYSRIQAYFDGQQLLLHLIPLIVRPIEESMRRYPHPDDVVRQLRTARTGRS